MEEKCPYVREKMGASFLGSPKPMDFAGFFMLWEIDGETHVIHILYSIP